MNIVWPEGEAISDDDLELLTTIGVHLSEIATNAQLHASLVEKEAIRQALLQALVEAQEGERANLARELHDGAGQSLTSLLIRLKILQKKTEPAEIEKETGQLCDMVSETIDQIRGLAYQLRPSTLEQFGLSVALRTLCEEMLPPVGIQCNYQTNAGELQLPFEVETTLYRIAQECLNNIVRHAAAERTTVELRALPYAIAMRIEDDGRGFDPKQVRHEGRQNRFGLLNMQERAEMLHGFFSIESAAGAGTAVNVRIPIQLEPKP
jgi:signal transduction histidine kinase